MSARMGVVLAVALPGCICEPGGFACGGQCVDLESDPQNCGICGRWCAFDQRCAAGQCRDNPECARDSDCDDLLVCNGAERCLGGRCSSGTRVECDDAVACTRDRCVEPHGTCASTPDHLLCSEGYECTGAAVDAPTGCRRLCPGDVAGACDPVLQCGCRGDAACYFAASATLVCAPAGTAAHGEACSASACAPGMQCLDGDLGGARPALACRRFCAADEDCTEGGRCNFDIAVGTTPTGYRACSIDCDLVEQDCPDGSGCHLLGTTTSAPFADCVALGAGPHGTPCTAHTDCRAGTLCVNFTEGARCARYCREAGDCTSRQCVGLVTPIVYAGVVYGVCT